VPSAILLLDHDERIVLANPQVRTVFGYGPDELLGQHAGSILPASWSQQRQERAEDVSDVIAAASGEERLVHRKDGTSVPVEISMNPLETADGTYWLVSIVDVSERSRLMQATARQRAELAHLSRVATLGALSGSLAHELNQPLAAILSNAQAAQRFLVQKEPRLDQVSEILADIVKNDRRAASVIQRLRALLKKEETQMRPVELNDLALDAIRLMHSDFVSRGIEVETHFADNLPQVNGDRVQLQQVLLNFLLNGCEAMEVTSGARRIAVTTRSSGSAGSRLMVSDRGHGISRERLAQIFEPFVTTKSQGLGLGLAICRSIIEAHGGKIWAANNDAGGATLTFELPAAHSTVTTDNTDADRVRS
jgi:PAS domain S-box-containing protein